MDRIKRVAGNLYSFRSLANTDSSYSSQVAFQKGIDAENEKNFRLALIFYYRAVSFGTDVSASALVNISSIKIKMMDFKGAKKVLRAAIKINPDYILAHYNMGCCLDGLGDIEGAIDSYHKVLKLDPLYFNANYNLGMIYFNRKEYFFAVKHLNTAIVCADSSSKLEIDKTIIKIKQVVGHNIGSRTLVLLGGDVKNIVSDNKEF